MQLSSYKHLPEEKKKRQFNLMESHISFVELLRNFWIASYFVELQLSHANFGSVFNMGYQFKNVVFSGKLSTKKKIKSKPLPRFYEM